MKSRLALLLLVAGYALLIVPFTARMKERPVAVKLGVMPSSDVLRVTAREHRFLIAEANVVRVLFYFGSLIGEAQRGIVHAPEYERMHHHLLQSLKLDPYNQDVYYFAQAIFTWDVGRVEEANNILDYGMRHRPRDWQLPYWAGFNSAYFLKDYAAAARYFQQAAEISGNNLFTKLAARYFHEAGESALGILFLDTMIQGAKDPNVKQTYQVRKEALLAAQQIQIEVERFREVRGRLPHDLDDLLTGGFMEELPRDPYGGTFYLDEQARVKSTSHFAFPTEEPESTREKTGVQL